MVNKAPLNFLLISIHRILFDIQNSAFFPYQPRKLQWKCSNLKKIVPSFMSQPWIEYEFGENKKQILSFAYRFLGVCLFLEAESMQYL